MKRDEFKEAEFIGSYVSFHMSSWLGHGTQLLVKHYSRCFCEGIFLDEVNI